MNKRTQKLSCKNPEVNCEKMDESVTMLRTRWRMSSSTGNLIWNWTSLLYHKLLLMIKLRF